MAFGLLSTTIEKTTKIAAGAYHIAKDVYNTLQAKNSVSSYHDVKIMFYLPLPYCT